MTTTVNFLILGLFPVFAIGVQVLPTVAQYEQPPPAPLPLYTYSEIFLPQYLDVPRLSVEGMQRAIPWLKFNKPANTQTQKQPFENKQQYAIYYSPGNVVLNKNTNLYSSIKHLDKEKDVLTNQFQHKGHVYLTSKPNKLSPNTADKLSQIRLRKERKLHSNNQHEDLAPNILQNSFTKQHDIAGIDEISLDGKGIRQLNLMHNENNFYPGTQHEYDNLENVRNTRLNECYNGAKKHCKQSRNKQRLKEKFICGKKCKERNKNNEKSLNNHFTNDELSPDHTAENNDELYKSKDDCASELMKRNPDSLDNCKMYNTELKYEPVNFYPKVPSTYLEPPTLAVDNYQFYREQEQKINNRKQPKHNAVKNRLQNHRLDGKEKNAVSLEENLKDHETEHIRNHAPEHLEEEATTSTEVDTSEHNKKEVPSDSFELSPDGERVEFQVHGYDGPKTYSFGFDTGLGENRHFRFEERLKNGTVTGNYGYYDPTGKLRTVQYTAEPVGGFRQKQTELNNHEPES